MTDVGSTWAGSHQFAAAGLERPSSRSELRRLVATSPRIRALGTRHSFNDIADGELLVGVDQLPPELEVTAKSARASAGTTFGVLAQALHERGRALHNMGSLPHIGIAGAVSTATHGSGVRNGNLSTAVSAVELVTADGDLLRLDRSDQRFAGAVVALGALGVVVAVEVDTRPSFQLRQDVYLQVPWERLLADPLDLLGAAYSVSVFTHWATPTLDRLWLKSELTADQRESVPANRFDGTLADLQLSPADGDAGDTTEQRTPGPWHLRLPHFRLDRSPSSHGEEIQTEYFVELADAAAALTVLREIGPRIDELLIITELRTTAADELWLSSGYRRPSLGIHFTWRRDPERVLAILPEIEARLAPFAARPHWGKWFTMGADRIAELYPRLDDFLALADELDPGRKFGNRYLSRVLGR